MNGLIHFLINFPHKETIGIIMIILGVISYVPYIKDMILGKTTPHVFSRFIWGINAIIIFFAMQSDHAGPGSWPVLIAGANCLFIAGYTSLFHKKNYIKPIDIIFLIISIIAILLRYFTQTPLWSLILLITADVSAFVPTVRKSRNYPRTETLSTFIINILKYILLFFALTNYSLITTLDGITWLILNIFFTLLLILRRRQITQTTCNIE